MTPTAQTQRINGIPTRRGDGAGNILVLGLRVHLGVAVNLCNSESASEITEATAIVTRERIGSDRELKRESELRKK